MRLAPSMRNVPVPSRARRMIERSYPPWRSTEPYKSHPRTARRDSFVRMKLISSSAPP